MVQFCYRPFLRESSSSIFEVLSFNLEFQDFLSTKSTRFKPLTSIFKPGFGGNDVIEHLKIETRIGEEFLLWAN